MAKIKGTIIVDRERCKGCEVCVASCPFDVLRLATEVNSRGHGQNKSNNKTVWQMGGLEIREALIFVEYLL